MAEEVKKTRKPRAPKKADAAAEVAVAVAEAVEPKKTAVAEVAVKSEKKTAAKRTRKKTAEQPQTETLEMPIEGKETAAEKPKKRSRSKKAEATKTEETAVVVAEEKLAEEPVKTAEKVEEKPAKKGQKTAEKSAKNSEKKQGKEAKSSPKKEEKSVALTRAQKKEIVKKLTKEVLKTECKWADLVDRVALRYQEEYPTAENANLNDVKGRVGSVLHVMQEEGEILVEGSLVKLPENKSKTEKESTVSASNEEKTVETDPTKTEEQAEKAEEKTAIVKVETAAPAPVYDLSALFDKGRSAKKGADPKKSVGDLAKEKVDELASTKPSVEVEKPQTPKKEEKAAVKTEKKSEAKATAEKTSAEKARKEVATRKPTRPTKADPLKEAFLKKLRSLGGNYFEYYAVYLLERYSRMNGRRLECLRVSGGEYDGGIDGELELTDRLGFRETIYIQAKNWEPTDEKWWIGETLLQQFIGAVAYRQAKEGKQHCRGMYITTSAFTAGAREMLEKMSDRFVGYDGEELYETAKECEFGLIKDGKGGWKIDEDLLSGKKSFFFMV